MKKYSKIQESIFRIVSIALGFDVIFLVMRFPIVITENLH